MEYMDGGIRYGNVRRNAHWYNAVLDTRLKPDIEADAIEVIDHYNDCQKNPTIGLLTRKQAETNNYPEFRKRNQKIFNQAKGIKELKEQFEKTFNETLYPRTKNIRKYLIEKEFVVLDCVKPRVKSFGKTLFKLFCR